jgi:GntR family transcriptional regulator
MLATSPIPLYYQVANVLRHRILDGIYQPGERIGTEAEMCREFGVSRITVRQALDELERENLLRRRRGVGTFVSERVPKVASISFTGFLEDLFAQGLLTENRDVQVEQVAAEEEVAAALQLEPEERVVRIERARWLAGAPLAHTVDYLPLSVGSTVVAEDLLKLPLLHILESRLGVHLEEAIQTIRAVLAPVGLAEMLCIRPGDPLLLVQRTVYAGGHPIQYVLTHYRADRYQYTVRLGRITRGER